MHLPRVNMASWNDTIGEKIRSWYQNINQHVKKLKNMTRFKQSVKKMNFREYVNMQVKSTTLIIRQVIRKIRKVKMRYRRRKEK